MSRVLALLLSMAVALPAGAQSLTIGNDVVPDASMLTAPPRTYIDRASPAGATGTVTAVRVSWSTAGCANAFKIKFFRRTGNSYAMIAERGPYAAGGTITLSSPVSVVQGDLIGIAHLAACGAPRVFTTTASDGYMSFPGDVTGTVTLAVPGAGVAYSRLALYGTGTATEAVEGVIAVAGSTAGSFGSNFKTSLHLFNPSSSAIAGRIVYRPQGTSTGTFPSLPYSLGPGQIVSYADVVAAMGQSGLGSLDLVVPEGQGEPMVTSRVYNDAGTSGTAGLTQDIIGCDEALKGMARVLRKGAIGYLFTPLDPAQSRMNIGVRALDSGAYLQITLRDASGATLHVRTDTYSPNWFEQVSAAAFVGQEIARDQTIEIKVMTGSAIVYGATTDNVTNDPSVQFAYVVFSTP